VFASVSLDGKTSTDQVPGGSATVRCPTGTELTGGGYSLFGGGGDFIIDTSEPNHSIINPGWIVTGHSISNTPQPFQTTLFVFARCGSLTP
jgi:hypothetical protein